MTRRPTMNRRTLLAASAAGAFALPGSRAMAQHSPKSLDQSTPVVSGSLGSRLVVGLSTGSLSMMSELVAFDTDLNQVGTATLPDGAVQFYATPNSDIGLVSTFGSTATVNLGTGDAAFLSVNGGDPGWIYPPEARSGESRAFGGDWFTTTGFAMDRIMLINAATGEGQDITPFVTTGEEPILPAMATFGASGTFMGLWTGDNCWLLDAGDPEAARILNGGFPGLFSTAFDISSDERWVAYTVYESGTENGHVILQASDDGEPVVVADGTAWSMVQFVPDLPDSFLLFNDGLIELRNLNAPTEPGESLGTIAAEPYFRQVTSADGMHRIIGSQDNSDLPLDWHRIDLEAGQVIPLDDLSSLEPMSLTTWSQDPRFIAFQPMTDNSGTRPAGPVIGLEIATGETFDLLDEIVPSDTIFHTTSSDGARALTFSMDGEAWILDLEARTAVLVPGEEHPGEVSGGAISPDGTIVAITVQQGSSPDQVLIVDPAAPETPTELVEGTVLGWS